MNSLNRGGAETFMVKLCNNIDREKYRMDFCVKSMGEGVYEPELRSLGCEIYHTTMRTENAFKCFFDIIKYVRKGKYKKVLVVSEFSLSGLDIIAAKLGGAKKCSMRSTNASFQSRKFNNIHKFFKPLTMFLPNVMIAPSSEAGAFTFGKKNMEKGKVKILHNGLPCEKYDFNNESREKIRKSLGVENNKVVCHVGRFSNQKNHRFLIDVFEKLAGIDENMKFILVGKGGKSGKEAEIKEKVKNLDLEDKVLFLGERNDVPQILSAADILVFPSLFEGMPNVVIESQAAGLPSVISDSITPEADITGIVKYLPLSKGAEYWAEETLKLLNSYERRSYINEIKDAGYDIESTVKRFTELVF